MILRTVLFSALLAMIVHTGYSQDVVETSATQEPSKHAIGAGFGATIGYGLLYNLSSIVNEFKNILNCLINSD